MKFSVKVLRLLLKSITKKLPDKGQLLGEGKGGKCTNVTLLIWSVKFSKYSEVQSRRSYSVLHNNCVTVKENLEFFF